MYTPFKKIPLILKMSNLLTKNERKKELLNNQCHFWIASDATSFPGSQTAGFSSFRPQSLLAVTHEFSLLVLSWLVAPF